MSAQTLTRILAALLSRIASLDDFTCPITRTIMKDPVIGTDGFTYERSAIEAWLQKNKKSPITRAAMYEFELVPNRAVRAAIARAPAADDS